MKLFAPLYYKDFKCIADKCSHSCCINWEIDIDEDSFEKYKKLTADYGKKVLQSIDTSDTPHFKLLANERCPHLNECGLCNIITNLGEEYLCEICREHPRFYNNTSHGKEVGLGLACEEACRIILGSDEYRSFFVLESLDGDATVYDFDPLPYRQRIFELLALDIPYAKRIELICNEFNISTTILSDENWRKLLMGLEYLDSEHKILFSTYSTATDAKYEKQLERALAYFVYRHCTQATDEVEFYMALGFSLF